MHRDLKMGLVSGMVVVIAATLYLATRPSLSSKHLRRRSISADSQPLDQGAAAANSPDPTVVDSPAAGSPPKDPNTFDWTIYEQEEKIKNERFHILRKNETLSDVAQQYYGSAAKWPKIYNANRSTIKNPNKLRPGTKIIIPE